MSWDYWDDYPRRPPLPANGIKAKTQRGKFGQTWWAGRWLAALERICGESRLERGRSYARRGQVIALDVRAGAVAAKVQGSRRTPYSVSIRLRTLPDADWERVIDAMAARAVYAAKLLSGEMPEQIEEVFAAVGASLLPAASKELITDCSCPDYANPCKHIAAVYYLLGERFDEDPFLMFELRGRPKDALLAALRERRGEAAAAESSEGREQEDDETPAVPLADIAVEDFWRFAAGEPALSFSFEAPPVDALPIKRLGPPSFAPDAAAFTERLEQLYRIIAEAARRLATGED
jgi:uncharacterized Zn finger protein